MLALFGAVLTGSFVSYYDKIGLNTGMSRAKFLFLKSVGILPFIPFLFLFFPFKLEFSVIFMLLLLLIVAVNITSSIGFVGVARKVSPHESMLYSSLSIPLVYFVDVLIGSVNFSFLNLFYLTLIIFGVLLLSSFKLNKITFKASLLLGVVSATLKGYLLYFFLKYTSPPVYLLLVYIITALILKAFFTKQIEKISIKDWKWAFVTQIGGVIGLALNTMLLTHSVSFYMLRIPLILIGLTLSSFFVKNKKVAVAPSFMSILAIIMGVTGIILFGLA